MYTTLSLLELIFVGSPLVVAGLHGYRTPFLKDIANDRQELRFAEVVVRVQAALPSAQR